MTKSPGKSIFIKAPDEAAALSAAELLNAATLSTPRPVALLDEMGDWIGRGPNHVLIVAVRVVETSATFDGQGNELTPAIFEAGWFANLRLRSGLWDVEVLAGLVTHLGVELKEPITPAQGWQSGSEKVTL